MVQQSRKRLESLEEEFKRYYLGVINHMEEEEDLEKEQAILDEHDDRVADVLDRLQQLHLHTECAVKVEVDPQQHMYKHLEHLE